MKNSVDYSAFIASITSRRAAALLRTASSSSGSSGDKDAIEQEVRAGGAEVIKCKGATYYAIALSVSQIAEAILRDTKMILTVSTLQDGSRYGVKDVCLSLPCVVGANGIEREITPPLLPEEEEAVRKSAAALREVIDAMKAE